MDDIQVLTELNETFIEAFRQGSWEMLRPILTDGFTFLNGNTGDVLTIEPYAASLQQNPVPALAIDQVVVQVDGDAAIVSARTTTTGETFSRYVDSYERRDGRWQCHHACVWGLKTAA